MSEKLEFTGERFTPECVREIRYEHVHRYALACQFCEDKSVLDAACGEGYGASMLAAVAGSVTGVDISQEAIDHASARYGSQDRLRFRQADVTCLPFADDSFERVVSFETLEHLEAQEKLLSEFRRVLKPDGLLLLSCPDKAVYTDEQGNDNPFHVRELYRDELDELIAREFAARRILGQKLMFHSAIWAGRAPYRLSAQTLASDDQLQDGVTADPVYVIAVCAAAEELLPDVDGGMWLFADEGESVYRHYDHEIRKNMAAGALLAARDAEIEQLKKQLADAQPRGWRRWFRRE